MNIRVALLTNIPAPYRLAFFRALSARCDLKVMFDSRSEPNRQWSVSANPGFAHVYMAGFAVPQMRRRHDGGPGDRRYMQIRIGILPALLEFRPDVVVSIEFGPRSIQAAAYCAAFRVPLIIWSEGTPHSEGWQSSLRRAIRRGLVRRAKAFWTNGIESSALLESYGAKPEQLQEGMIGVSTAKLSRDVHSQMLRRERIRAELGLKGVVFLFSGQLVPRKGVKEFLAALLPLAPRAQDFSVMFLGEGMQRSLIEQWAFDHPDFRLLILGFRQPEDVPRIYAAADIFVMPTLDDNWSLVALEAAVAGLPQIFSTYNGATRDLLQRKAGGTVVDPLDTEVFSAALMRFLDAGPARVSADVTSLLIDYYGPDACADRALQSVLTAAKPRQN
jgi:glycosyltransferase involved in cell wall biosynthesis